MINIRSIVESDLTKIHEWSNRQVSSYFLLEGLGFASLDEFYSEFNEPSSNEMIIETNSTQQPIGMVKYVPSSCLDRKAELFISIFEKQYFKCKESLEAANLILKYLFNHENLERIYSYVFEDEIELFELLTQVGLKKEGQLREQSYFNGKYHDLLVLGILRSELMS